MKNHEIPSKIWALRNQIISRVETLMSNSNNEHEDYKKDFMYGAECIRSLCLEIEILAEKYVQPNQD